MTNKPGFFMGGLMAMVVLALVGCGQSWSGKELATETSGVNLSREVSRGGYQLVREMPHNRMESYCCGAGSGNWPGPFEKEKTEHGSFKAEDIRTTGADLLIAGCSNCRDQIMKNLKPKFKLDIEVKYIWEMIADALILEG